MKTLTAVLIFVFFLISTGCSSDDKALMTRERSWQCMGTIANLTTPANIDAGGYVKTCANICEKIEDELSVYNPESLISSISNNAGRKSVPVRAPTLSLIMAAVRYAEISNGAFDPSVLPLVDIWGLREGESQVSVPKPSQIKHAKKLVGYSLIDIDVPGLSCNGKDQDGTVFLGREGMRLDLGGIAKGYAVDTCYETLKADALNCFIIGIGGNLRVSGERLPGKAWRIGVRDPFDRQGLLGWLELSDGLAVATSGNYERFVEIDGQRYAHIINPKTGFPVKGMAQVTVIASTGLEADALSTTLFVLGVKDGSKFLRNYSGAEALFVTDTEPVRYLVTPGFKSCFHPGRSFARRMEILTVKE